MPIGLARSASSPQRATDAVPAHSADAFENWRMAGMRVRLCVNPDEPLLVHRYLACADKLHIRHGLSRWEIALESAWLLIAAADDRGLPLHWRCLCLCLNHVCGPLATLDRLADNERRQRQRRALRWELVQLDLDPIPDNI